VAGNVWDITSLTPKLPTNLTLSIGRSLIADPAFVEKSLLANNAPIIKCVRAGHCHYYSRNKPHIECCVNAHVGGNESYHAPMRMSDEEDEA